MSKRVKVFIVDSQMQIIDSLNDYLIKYPEFHIDMIGKSVSKNEFMNNKEIFMDVDVFIVSSSLPDGTGLELYEYIKSIRALSDVPIIFTVDKQTRNQIATAENLGVENIFQKPFKAGDLYKRILFLGLKKKGFIPNVSLEVFNENPLSYVQEDITNTKVDVPKENTKKDKKKSNDSSEIMSRFKKIKNNMSEINTPPIESEKTTNKYEENEIFQKFNNTDSGNSNTPNKNTVYDLDYDEQQLLAIEKNYQNVASDLDLGLEINKTNKDEKTGKKTKDIDGGIISFFSPKSTGKTSIIVNVARGLLGSKTKPSVCILDLNYHYPSTAHLFKQDELIKPNRDIYDVFADTSYMNEELIESALIKHEPSGINIVNVPNDLESVSKINLVTTEQVEKVLLQIREMFDFVLVDTHNEITSPTNLTLLEHSSRNYVILEPDFTTVTGGNKILQAIKILEEDKMQDIIKDTYLIMNKDTKKPQDSLNDSTITNFMFGKKFITRIPYDEDFNSFINKAEFIITSSSPSARPLMILTNHIYPKSGIKESKKTPFNLKIPKINIPKLGNKK